MKHRATAGFWKAYAELPEPVRRQADRAFDLMRDNPRHPSLRLKKVGEFWSARVDTNHRALAIGHDGSHVWIWIGTHHDYERLIR